jgi:hypothetical protein
MRTSHSGMRRTAQHSTRSSADAAVEPNPAATPAAPSHPPRQNAGSARLMGGLRQLTAPSPYQALKNRLLAAQCPKALVNEFHLIFKQARPDSFYAAHIMADLAAHGHSSECLERHVARMHRFLNSCWTGEYPYREDPEDFITRQKNCALIGQSEAQNRPLFPGTSILAYSIFPECDTRLIHPRQLTVINRLSLSEEANAPGTAEIALMRNLRALSIRSDGIRAPWEPTWQQIKDFPKLDYLEFNGGRFSTISEDVFETVRKLKTVFLDRGVLTSLPDSIKNLTELRHLNLRNNHFTTVPRVLLELDKDKAEMVSRRAAGKTVPMLVLPQTAAEAEAAENQGADTTVQAIAADNGHVHTVQALVFFKKIVGQLAAQFPDVLQGDADAQRAEMQAIQERFLNAMDTHASKASKNPLKQVFDKTAQSKRVEKIGRQVAQEMFQIGLGHMAAYANDLQFSAGHVLSYVFIAMEKQWARLPSDTPQEKAHLQATQQKHMDSILTVLSFEHKRRFSPVFGRICDTRNIEELAQLVDTYDLAKLPPPNQAITEIGLPAATQSLAALMTEHPGLNDAGLQTALRPLWDAVMKEKFPRLTPVQRSEFFDGHILPGWDILVDLAQKKQG